ncbi:MAG: hypothetical protein R2750_05725 [Bacteroidales bacterium]
MKKNLTILLILTGFVSLAYFSSCTKIDEETTPKSLTYAIIKGEAKANLDLSNDTNSYGGFEIQWEKVPLDTKVFARINSEDLQNEPTDDLYQDILFETSVDNSGNYEVQVYAGNSNTYVTLFADNFKFDQKINDSVWEEKIFAFQTQEVMVSKNMTKTFELIFIP